MRWLAEGTLFILIIIIAGTIAALAQTSTPNKPANTVNSADHAEAPRETAPKPLLLTKDQVERLAAAEQRRQLARDQLAAAQNFLDKIDARVPSAKWRRH
ncbi:MAG TPA: hypothetical protein VJ810_13865 [Blastocatellia bacterium]|nr:hypothetical protein [Blastocatellia bacterium]